MEASRRFRIGDSLVGLNSPELPDMDKDRWINSEPLKIKSIKNKIIMIDFWTYSCVNCLRTLPYLKKWHESYSDKGFLIIGVHSPEFEFEKSRENVERFIIENEIKYPVVLDNDYQIWNLFTNKYWPRKLMIGTDGKIVFDHIGEGAYEETEMKIQELISGIGQDASKMKRVTLPASSGICYPMTPETYCGYKRGIPGNKKGFSQDKLSIYENPGSKEEGAVYLDGPWLAAPEYLQYGSDTIGGYLEIVFKGVEVNAVMKVEKGAEVPVRTIIKLNGSNVERDAAGEDISWDEQGQSFIDIKEPRMYRIINSRQYVEGTIRLLPEKSSFRIYAFTFGNCL